MFNSKTSPSIVWRSDSTRLSEAAIVLSDGRLASMMAVVELEHPQLNHKEPQDGFGSTYILGKIDGFNEAIKILRSLAVPLPTSPQEIKSTFGFVEETIK